MRRVLRVFFNYFLFHPLNLLMELLPNHSISNKIRGRVYALFFKRTGYNFQVAKGVIINCMHRMEVGDNVYIAHGAWINASGGLFLDDNVIISPKVVIATTKHAYVDGSIQLFNGGVSRIKVGKGCWIASNSTIILGVEIGDGCIVAANSCVTKTIDSYTMVGGVPAKYIKSLK